MTIICWDGETLAADSFLFAGEDAQIIIDKSYNKIWLGEKYIFSVCGSESDYFRLEKQMKKITSEDDLMDIELGDESEAIVFWKDNKKEVYAHDGQHMAKYPKKMINALGGPEEYALALLQAKHKSEEVVRNCILYHTYAGGKVNSIIPKEYFGW